MDKENLDELTVNGYVFSTHDDAETAKNEIKKIALIESKTDMNNMTVVKGLYNKALESHTFQTPIGLEFMHNLYIMLIASGINRESIQPIKLYTTFKRLDFSEKATKKRNLSPKEQKELSLKAKYRNSVLISCILGVMVIAMVLITLNGSNMNALNYKQAVSNQYAEWEQELTERERAVREKERELGINYVVEDSETVE